MKIELNDINGLDWNDVKYGDVFEWTDRTDFMSGKYMGIKCFSNTLSHTDTMGSGDCVLDFEDYEIFEWDNENYVVARIIPCVLKPLLTTDTIERNSRKENE